MRPGDDSDNKSRTVSSSPSWSRRHEAGPDRSLRASRVHLRESINEKKIISKSVPGDDRAEKRWAKVFFLSFLRASLFLIF